MPSPMPGRRRPINTYRLQLSASFTFADAAARLPYLDALGVTDLYLSPILTAVPGSTHGYDVVDPTRVSEELGGRAGFEALATAAHTRGIGVIVDIVPNHMAIPEPLWLNPALWSVLRDGPNSRYADWFDIEAGAALVLPVVSLDGDDDPIPRLIADSRLRFGSLDHSGTAEPVILLDDHPYPLAPETVGRPLAESLPRQRYSLQRWQGNHTRLTHRRFFDIVNLIGVRQELPEVFEATHAELLDLYHAGQIDGFRVDHPDGLADPQGYFERLRDATGGAWVVAEKILTGDELLPLSWPVAGTTGYEAAWRFDAVQLDPDAAEPLARLAQHTDRMDEAAHLSRTPAPNATSPTRTIAWPEVAEAAKRHVANTSLASDVDRLIRLAAQVFPNCSDAELRRGLEGLLVAMDRYRAYIRPGDLPDAAAAEVLAEAASRATATLPAHLRATLTRLHELASGVPDAGGMPASETAQSAAAEFVIRFQQVTGALVAKGVEDTAFYRWTQLLTLCDVGADPATFGLSPARLHSWLSKVNTGWPTTMALGSSHDSKRSEDVRARIAAISEYPAEWAALVENLEPAASNLPAPIHTILWQTLAGTWSGSGPIEPDRLAAFAVKAGREQKLWTSWVSPDGAAEATLVAGVTRLIAEPAVQEWFDRWTGLVAESVRTNTLCAKLVQLTALGVADVFQGCETVRLSLTDPDNRRPVDWPGLATDLRALGERPKPDTRPSPVDSGTLPSDQANHTSRHRSHGHHRPDCDHQPDRDQQPDCDHRPDCDQQPDKSAAPNQGHPGWPDRPAARDERLAAEKLFLTTTALRLRGRNPAAFTTGAYTPLASTSPYAWGFARGDAAVTIATRLPRRRRAGRAQVPGGNAAGTAPSAVRSSQPSANSGTAGPGASSVGGARVDLSMAASETDLTQTPDWAADDLIALPGGTWRNLLTGASHHAQFRLGQDLGGWPCALLERVG